jgi:hypothetical protein
VCVCVCVWHATTLQDFLCSF